MADVERESMEYGVVIVGTGPAGLAAAIRLKQLGPEIFPGMAASALVFDGDRVAGVVAGEFGLEKDRTAGPSYEPGMELRGKYALIGEGCAGRWRSSWSRSTDFPKGASRRTTASA